MEKWKKALPVTEGCPVVSISPDMTALAPDRKHPSPLSASSPLPPASLMEADGRIKRYMATILFISSSLSLGTFSYGVPGIGFSMLIGTLLIPNSFRANAISIRSSSVSPSPIMPPLHTFSPASWAARMAATLSSKVWVVHTRGKFFLDVSRLLCTRDTPASRSLTNCSLSRSQKETQISIFTVSLILRIVLHI